MEAKNIQGVPIVCRRMGPEFQAREGELRRKVFSAVAEARELSDGYALRFPDEAHWLATLAGVIRFELHAEQQDGAFWLWLRGPEGVKAFIAELLGRWSPPRRSRPVYDRGQPV